jgi:hypothetical protein
MRGGREVRVSRKLRLAGLTLGFGPEESRLRDMMTEEDVWRRKFKVLRFPVPFDSGRSSDLLTLPVVEIFRERIGIRAEMEM